MTTGAFFEPKALWGSTSWSVAAAWGVGGGAASVASGADGRTGGCSAEAGAAVGAADIGTGPGGGAIEGRVGVLCSEGRNKAPKTSKVMLTIAARTRLRFTPPSRRFANMMFATRTRRFYREM